MEKKNKKRKLLKAAAFLTAAIFIIGLGIFANALVGNPVSKMLAKRTANAYLDERYADTDFYIESVHYSFKLPSYTVKIKSKSSDDSYFSLEIDSLGKLLLDHYDSMVANRGNTARRLDDAYRNLTDAVWESPSFPFTLSSGIAYGILEFTPQDYAQNSDIPSYALMQEDLELDGLYDIQKLGRQAGHLVVYIEDDLVTTERAAEILLEIRRLMDEAGAPFYAIDLTLQPPRAEGEHPMQAGNYLTIKQFLYADIYPDGLKERIERLH